MCGGGVTNLRRRPFGSESVNSPSSVVKNVVKIIYKLDRYDPI
jgi:hypothetical protein